MNIKFLLIVPLIFSNLCFATEEKDSWVLECEDPSGERQNTYMAIREATGIFQAASCDQAFARKDKINKMDLSNKDLTNLSPLRIFRNLTSLNISKNKIKDIRVFRKLPKLSFVQLEYNFIDDLSAAKRIPYVIGTNQQMTRKSIEYKDRFLLKKFDDLSFDNSFEMNLFQNIDKNRFNKEGQNFLLKMALLNKLASHVARIDPENDADISESLLRNTSSLIDKYYEELFNIFLIRSAVKATGLVATISGSIIVTVLSCGVAAPVTTGALISTGITASNISAYVGVHKSTEIVKLSKEILLQLKEEASYESKIQILTMQRKLESKIAELNSVKHSEQWTTMLKLADKSSIGEDLVPLRR